MASTPHSPDTRKSTVTRSASARSASGRSEGRRQTGSGQRGRADQRKPSAASSSQRADSGVRGARGANGVRAKASTKASQRRKPSRRLQRIYRRRRIGVALALALVLALVAFCVYSLGRGFSAVAGVIRHDDITALARQPIPSSVKDSSGVQDCTAEDVRLELGAQSQTVPVAGSLEFTMTVAYDGTSSCLIDVSNASRVLTITSGSDTIWKSDVCPAKPHMLLMSKGDRRLDTLTWNTDATGSTCAADASLPKVRPGTYVATLSLKGDAKAVSKPVTVAVR
ncbi:hypothetical protein [Bifidobacterium sp.]|jgi:hypothetical protein|uniref:hypothetical protein n=1 Tax=Bifidobacterium sp. TaxID=41200 RepID=UPI0025C4C650|nr:hypothetical protein [Bifidobacterium sp.]MCH4208839.1 hypothetical protein [Bifidobacterium sp.]MCI1225447.1 hypothetical protein [Bifidobacterium sp.]